jgi:hypothetical protein
MTEILTDSGFPTPAGAATAHDQVDRRRALEAYHFFYPTVSMEGILRGTQAAVAAAGAGTAILMVAAPRHVGFTMNSDTPYSGGILPLDELGPVVIELPPGPLVGLIDDHHHRWIADVGLPGPDGGKGGKHLVLPPDYEGEAPTRAISCPGPTPAPPCSRSARSRWAVI